MELVSRFTAWLAHLDEQRGKIENPAARLTGREFYALAATGLLAVLLVVAIAWRSGVNMGVGSLPYRAAAARASTAAAGSAYVPADGAVSAQDSTR